MNNPRVLLSDGRDGEVILDTVKHGKWWHARVVVVAVFGPAEVYESPSPDATEPLARERARVLAMLRYEPGGSQATQMLH
ncbi:MAG: hypothetical protein ABI330_07495 [Caldimonas sp.]